MAKKTVIPNKVKMQEQPASERVHNYEEVPYGYTPEQAMEEAIRCLQCAKPTCMDGCPVNVDIPGLPVLLDTPAAYLGVIGSQRRWATTRKALLEQGVSPGLIDKARSPLGLELNAETPEEIAVSILAEIIMLRNGGSGRVMSA